jgi:hypothetical protein
MAIQLHTTPARAGERGRLPNRPQSGPVTLAIRAMRQTGAASWQARQDQDERAALHALRTRIAAQFAADAALLEGIGA